MAIVTAQWMAKRQGPFIFNARAGHLVPVYPGEWVRLDDEMFREIPSLVAEGSFFAGPPPPWARVFDGDSGPRDRFLRVETAGGDRIVVYDWPPPIKQRIPGDVEVANFEPSPNGGALPTINLTVRPSGTRTSGRPPKLVLTEQEAIEVAECFLPFDINILVGFEQMEHRVHKHLRPGGRRMETTLPWSHQQHWPIFVRIAGAVALGGRAENTRAQSRVERSSVEKKFDWLRTIGVWEGPAPDAKAAAFLLTERRHLLGLADASIDAAIRECIGPSRPWRYWVLPMIPTRRGVFLTPPA